MDKDFQDELTEIMQIPHSPVECIWMNQNTADAFLKTHKAIQDPLMIFSGIPINIDNTLPDWFYETNEQRALRFKEPENDGNGH